jgi:hypothetical protein
VRRDPGVADGGRNERNIGEPVAPLGEEAASVGSHGGRPGQGIETRARAAREGADEKRDDDRWAQAKHERTRREKGGGKSAFTLARSPLPCGMPLLYLRSYLDDTRLFDYALSSSEIAGL